MKCDLKSRLDEHKRAIKNQRPDFSAVCEHSITVDHIISWIEAKLETEETGNRQPETTIFRKQAYKCKTACHETMAIHSLQFIRFT